MSKEKTVLDFILSHLLAILIFMAVLYIYYNWKSIFTQTTLAGATEGIDYKTYYDVANGFVVPQYMVDGTTVYTKPLELASCSEYAGVPPAYIACKLGLL